MKSAHRHILLGQLLAAHSAGLPLPGTTEAQKLLRVLPKPVIDTHAPEVRAERQQIQTAMKLSRRQQRKAKQDARRGMKTLQALTPADAPLDFTTGEPRRLDLSLIDKAVRRAKQSALTKEKP